MPGMKGMEGRAPAMQRSIDGINLLEHLALGRSCVHRLHPLAKLLASLVYILSVVSFGRNELAPLFPFILYPFILTALAGIPFLPILKRVAVALPFCLFAGLSNLAFDREPALYVSGLAVSSGAVSLVCILLRTLLCVMAVLVLVSTTPFAELSAQLRTLRVPGILVTVLELTYRYIGTLLAEAGSMLTAYSLRGNGRNGVELRHAGSFVGHLLLRSLDRAERVYGAMKCRGYSLSGSRRAHRKLASGDLAFLGTVCLSCALFRFVDAQSLLARGIGRFLSC